MRRTRRRKRRALFDPIAAISRVRGIFVFGVDRSVAYVPSVVPKLDRRMG